MRAALPRSRIPLVACATWVAFMTVCQYDGYDGAVTTSIAELDVDHEFSRHWPGMKGKMCPGMKPRGLEFGPLLFELAQNELGIARGGTIAPMDREFFQSFFGNGPGSILLYSTPDDEHHMAYMSIWKCANVQIRSNLESILPTFGSVSTVRKWKDVPSKIPDSRLNATCLVMVVRDPVSHFLSGYNECEGRNTAEYGLRRWPIRGWQWAENGSDPSLFTHHGIGTNARFENFVMNFIGNPKKVGIVPDATELRHVYSMTGPLAGLDEWNTCPRGTETENTRQLSLAGYLPSLNQLDISFPDFLNETCPDIPRIYAFTKKVEHASSADPHGSYSAARRVWKEGGRTAKALCAIHALDYACFDMVPVPHVCKEVFVQEDFRRMVHGAPTGDYEARKCKR